MKTTRREVIVSGLAAAVGIPAAAKASPAAPEVKAPVSGLGKPHGPRRMMHIDPETGRLECHREVVSFYDHLDQHGESTVFIRAAACVSLAAFGYPLQLLSVFRQQMRERGLESHWADDDIVIASGLQGPDLSPLSHRDTLLLEIAKTDSTALGITAATSLRDRLQEELDMHGWYDLLVIDPWKANRNYAHVSLTTQALVQSLLEHTTGWSHAVIENGRTDRMAYNVRIAKGGVRPLRGNTLNGFWTTVYKPAHDAMLRYFPDVRRARSGSDILVGQTWENIPSSNV